MTLQETLLAFGKKTAGKDQVMRALCEHTGWFAPAVYACLALKTQTFEKITLWGAEANLPPGKLYLFTDVGAGNLASQKLTLGPYASPLPGAPLLSYLPAGFKELVVNPGSPQEQGWFMGDGALPFASIWGQAVHIEQMLVGKLKGDLVDVLLKFPGWTSFALPNGAIATAVGAGGLKNPAMIFTAPDCADLAFQKLGPQAASLKRMVTSGEDLFGAYPRLGIDGFLVNPFGPGMAKVLDGKVAEGIVESIALRKKAEALEAEAKRLAENT